MQRDRSLTAQRHYRTFSKAMVTRSLTRVRKQQYIMNRILVVTLFTNAIRHRLVPLIVPQNMVVTQISRPVLSNVTYNKGKWQKIGQTNTNSTATTDRQLDGSKPYRPPTDDGDSNQVSQMRISAGTHFFIFARTFWSMIFTRPLIWNNPCTVCLNKTIVHSSQRRRRKRLFTNFDRQRRTLVMSNLPPPAPPLCLLNDRDQRDQSWTCHLPFMLFDGSLGFQRRRLHNLLTTLRQTTAPST